MNIGLFSDTYYPQVSGVATSMQTLKNELEKLGHNVYIFTSTDPKVDKNSEEEQKIFRFASIPYAGFKDRRLAYRGAYQAVQLAKSLNLDIVHTQTEFSLGIIGKLVAKQLKIPAIHTYHTMYQDYTHYVLNGRLIKPGAVSVLLRGYLKKMDGVIAPTTLVEDVLKDCDIEIPIKIIPTGIPSSFKDSKDNHELLRQKLGFTADTPVLLSLGRIAFEKNIEESINAFSEVLEKLPEAEFVIAGDGPALESLKDHTRSLGIENKVHFVGMVDHEDVYSYYRMADVFISSSDTETQGLTMIEAMQANRPFICRNYPFLKDIVVDDTIGTMVDEEEETAETIYKYLVNKEQYKHSASRDQQLEKTSGQTFAKNVHAFYEEVIQNHIIDEDLADDETELQKIINYMKSPFKKLKD